ncbi:MAG: PAQR family membrane homeostasis protein TrhA [Gemmatimonadaceae bacterium]
MQEPVNGAKHKRLQTRGEEIANAVSHGSGLLASLALLPVLVTLAVRHHDAWLVAGVAVFGASVALLYATSTFYHWMPHGTTAKRVWRVLDHSAIYILIAGTYTPFALGAMRGVLGYALLALMWASAVVGVVLKSGGGFGHPRLSTVMYVVMGWTAILFVRPMWHAIGTPGLAWILAGGLAYTGGVVFYARDHRRYHHFLWHLCVMAGTACHFVAVLGYAGGVRR